MTHVQGELVFRVINITFRMLNSKYFNKLVLRCASSEENYPEIEGIIHLPDMTYKVRVETPSGPCVRRVL
jgi:hypothetical protein